MNEIDIPRIEDFIKRLDEKGLLYLNQLIVDRLKIISQVRSSEKMSEFHTEQRVVFTTPDGREKRGIIKRMHKKTVTIHTDDNESWNVAPGFLKPVD